MPDLNGPRFLTLQDAQFWEKVYLASLKEGMQGLNASSAADKALARRQERMSDYLRGEEMS